MSMLVWNCQGAASLKFFGVLKSFLRNHRPQVLVLVEPRISGAQADKVIKKIKYPRSHRVDAQGFSGGIWLLWTDAVVVDILYSHTQFIHALIHWPDQGDHLTFSAVYGSPNPSTREHLWTSLKALALTITTPWVLSGDFNATLLPSERQGGSVRRSLGCKSFIDFVTTHQLVDLGFSGPKFTWRRGTQFARLDRALANTAYLSAFPNIAVQHLPKIQSDHRPLLITMHRRSPPPVLSHSGFFLLGSPTPTSVLWSRIPGNLAPSQLTLSPSKLKLDLGILKPLGMWDKRSDALKLAYWAFRRPLRTGLTSSS